MKRKIIYTNAPPEIEEAIEKGKVIPNFIDVDLLVRKDNTRPMKNNTIISASATRAEREFA